MWVCNIGVHFTDLGCDNAEWIQPTHDMVPVNTAVRLKIVHRGKFFLQAFETFFSVMLEITEERTKN